MMFFLMDQKKKIKKIKKNITNKRQFKNVEETHKTKSKSYFEVHGAVKTILVFSGGWTHTWNILEKKKDKLRWVFIYTWRGIFSVREA